MVTDGTALLEAAGVEKAFGATRALKGLDFRLKAGEIHALIGGNGAGKSTFIKILAGIHDADGGSIIIAGRPLDGAARSLLSFIHQDAGLVPTMTVAENFGLIAGFPGRFGVVNDRALRATARSALEELGVAIDPSAVVSTLSTADRAMVAIARAVRTPARVLVLDEPTANLPASDVARLWEIVRAFAARGVGIVYVTHRLKEVFQYCDRVTVVRDGVTRAQLDPASLDERELAQLVTGTRAAAAPAGRGSPVAAAEPVLQVTGLTTALVRDVTFEVRPGEILALTGLRGTGQDEVAERLFGLVAGAGEITVAGRPVPLRSPAEALAAGIAHISGDRGQTLARGLSITENVLLNPRFTHARSWITRRAREQAVARAAVTRFAISPPDETAPVGSLSGGNAQKVVIARAEQADPRILVLHEPTSGVDVGARAEFYDVVRARCAGGMAVLLVSSDYEEVEMLADRVLVFADGRVVQTIAGSDITESAVAGAAMGVRR